MYLNAKQRASMSISVAMYVAAIFCASEAWVGPAIVLLVLGLVSGIAIWTLGLQVRSDATDKEWMNAIR